MLTPLPDRPVSARRSSTSSTGGPLQRQLGGAHVRRDRVRLDDGQRRRCLAGPALAQDRVVDARVDVGEQQVVEHALAPPGRAPRASDSSTAAVLPPMSVRKRPRVIVPDLTKAIGAFFSIASVASIPLGMSRNSMTASAGTFFIT